MLTRGTSGRRARGHLVTILLVLALLAAACGNPDAGVQQDPGGSLRDAFAELTDYEGYELRLGLDLDEVAVAAAVRDGDLTAEQAALISDSSLLVRTRGGGLDADVEYAVTIGGDELIGVRILSDFDVYVRADLDRLVALADDDGADLDGFVAAATDLGLGDIATAFRAGQWIRITGLQQVMTMYEGMIRGMLGADLDELGEMGEQMLTRLAEAVGRFLEDGVTVEYVGSEDLGERVRATADGDALRTLVTDVVEVLMTSVAGFGAFDATGGDEFMEELRAEMMRELTDSIPPDLTLSFDAWLSRGRLTQVAVDLGQFPDAPEGRMMITLGLDEFTGAIEAPDDATEVDLFWLLGRLMGAGF